MKNQYNRHLANSSKQENTNAEHWNVDFMGVNILAVLFTTVYDMKLETIAHPST